MYTVDQYDDQGTGHNDTLDQVGGTCCQESSQCGVSNDDQCTDVSYDNNSTYDHGRHIRYAEQCGKQFAAGCESGCGVRYEENYDHNR